MIQEKLRGDDWEDVDNQVNKYKDKVVSENYNPTRLIQDDYYKKLKPYFTEIRTLSAPELEKYIPAYMLPRTIKIIDKLPINQNGKIDRKVLSEL